MEELHVPYVAVVGHTDCGGVKAALRDATSPHQKPGALGGWLANLTQLAKKLGLDSHPGALVRLTEENIKNTMQQVKDYIEGPSVALSEGSGPPGPEPAEVIIVGMEYNVETGLLREVGERLVARVHPKKIIPTPQRVFRCICM